MWIVNRIASAVLGLALIAGGLLAAVEAVLAFAGREPLLPLRRWYADLVDTTYSDRVVLVVAIGIGLLGLLILIAQLRPRRPDRFDLRTGPADTGDTVRWSLHRRSLEQQVAAAVAGVPGVGVPLVEVAGKETDWSIRVRATGRADQRDSVRNAARAALGRLDAPTNVGLTIDLRETRRVS